MKTFRNIRNEVEPVAVSLEKHVKELNNFSRRHRRAEEAKKKFSTEVLSLIFKRLKEEKNAEELMNVGDTLSRAGISSAHYFYEAAFRLDPSKIK